MEQRNVPKVLYFPKFWNVRCCERSSINSSHCLITLTLYTPLCSSASLLAPDALAIVQDGPSVSSFAVLDIIAEADRRPVKV